METPTQESIKTQVIKDAAVYIPSTYVAQMLGFINAFLIRRLLGPTMMGIWATLQIILNYSGYVHLGSYAAGAKEIPYQLGRKDQATAEQIKDNIFTFSILMACLGAVLLCAASWFFAKDLNWPMRIGLVAIGFILIGQRIYNLTIMLLRGYKNFALLSKVTIVMAALDVSLVGVLVWSLGIYGLYLAVLGSLILATVYAWKHSPYRVHFELNRNILRGLARIGLPMFILGLAMTLLRTMDKILVVKYMGVTQMGIYSIAVMASNYVYGLANTVGVLTLPRFSENFGEKGDVAILGSYMDQANKIMGMLLPVILGGLYFLAPMLIRIFLKQYVPGIPAMQVLMLGTFFLCLVHQPNNFLLAMGKQAQILPSMIAGVIVSFLLNYWAVRGLKDITCAAWATTVSYLVTFLILFTTANAQIKRKESFWILLFQALAPFAYVVGVLLLLDFLFKGRTEWWVAPLEIFLFALACLWPVWKLDKQTQVLRKAYALFVQRSRSVMGSGEGAVS